MKILTIAKVKVLDPLLDPHQITNHLIRISMHTLEIGLQDR